MRTPGTSVRPVQSAVPQPCPLVGLTEALPTEPIRPRETGGRANTSAAAKEFSLRNFKGRFIGCSSSPPKMPATKCLSPCCLHVCRFISEHSTAIQAERCTSVAAAHASHKVTQRRAMSAARNPHRLTSGKGNVGSRSRSASMMRVIVGAFVNYGNINVVERPLPSEANQTAW